MMDFLSIFRDPFSLRSIRCRRQGSPQPAVVSSALTSASNSRVSRVTSLPGGVRARLPLPFREESHLRWMKVTRQSEQGTLPGPRILLASSALPLFRRCRRHLASLILKEALCLTGSTAASWQELETVLFPEWITRAGAALGLGVPQLTVKPFSDSGKNRAREGQVRAQVSFLPERLQLSMAFEAPRLL